MISKIYFSFLVHGKIKEEYEYTCENCSKKFKYASQLRFHINHQCPYGSFGAGNGMTGVVYASAQAE